MELANFLSKTIKFSRKKKILRKLLAELKFFFVILKLILLKFNLGDKWNKAMIYNCALIEILNS